jgi:hypothetical protein
MSQKTELSIATDEGTWDPAMYEYNLDLLITRKLRNFERYYGGTRAGGSDFGRIKSRRLHEKYEMLSSYK